MNEQEKARIHQRVRALYRYTNAMEQGESEAVSAVLEEARQDPALERMVLELNEIYQIEDSAIAQPDEIALAHEMLLDVFSESPEEHSVLASHLEVGKASAQEPARQVQPVPVRAKASVRRPARKWQQSRIAALVAVALLAVLIVPVFSAFAPQFLALFRPQQFTAVNSNAFRDPMQVANSLDSFFQRLGDNTTENYTSRQLASPTLSKSAAEQQVHFPIQLPTTLPAGVGQTLQFTATPSDQEVFTFDAAKTRSYLQQSGQTGVSVPTQLDGATFKVTLEAGVIVTYYQRCIQASGKLQCSGGTPLIVTEVPDPTIQAEGSASLSTLRAFLLSLPELPENVRTLLQRVDVNSGVVPVPLPQGASSTQATVKGSSALIVTLSGNGGIIWESQNIVYIILTTHTSGSQIEDIANSLK
jgi:hypothetical protein